MNWPIVALKNVAPYATSETRLNPSEPVWHLTLDQIESGTGYINEKKIAPASSASSSTYVFDEKNVLYSKLRPYLNKVVCPDEPGTATTELVPLKPDQAILDRRFLTYYLRSPRFVQFASAAVAGVKMPRVIMAKFWAHMIPLPPLTEQHRIVEILDQADALRKKRAEANAKTTRILPALFYKMFGDPATNQKKWEMVSLGEVTANTRNGIYKPAEFYGSGIGILKMFNIQNGELDLSRIDRIQVTQDEYETYCLLPGDILVNRVNTPELVGKCAVITEDVGKAVFESKNIRLRLLTGRACPEYITTYLNTPHGHSLLARGVKHAIGMATINNADLSTTPVMLPDLSLQVKWAEFVHNFRNMQKHRDTAAKKLSLTFSNLLHRAFSGKLTKRWREAHMKELFSEMEHHTKALSR